MRAVEPVVSKRSMETFVFQSRPLRRMNAIPRRANGNRRAHTGGSACLNYTKTRDASLWSFAGAAKDRSG